MKHDVVNNEREHRFELNLNGELAQLEYKLQGDAAIAFIHTEVPEAMEGHGIASELAHHALEYARSKQLKVKPYCSFVKVYLERHKEYKDLVE
jgi:predicted GNAT family acetyltransferase